MSPSRGVAIEIDGPHVCAVSWKTRRGSRVFDRSASCRLDIDPDASAEDTATAIKDGLGKRMLSGGEIMLIAPRADVAVKTVRVPNGIEPGTPEARSAVQLAARAQSPFGNAPAVVSLDPMRGVEINAYTILASKLDWLKTLGRRLGARRVKVIPRAACFAAASGDEGDALLLVVAEGGGSFEVGARRGTRSLQARSRPVSAEADTELILSEVGRVWTSVRLLGEDLAGAACVVLGFAGRPELAGLIATSIGVKASQTLPDDVLDGCDATASVSAAVAVTMPEATVASLDFVEAQTPTAKTDPVRAVAMLGLLLLILLAGAAYLWVDTTVRGLDQQLGAVREQNRALSAEYLQHLARDARLQHHKAFRAFSVPIADEIEAVAQAVGGHADGVRVDDISITRRGEVVFRPGDGAAYPGRWRYSGATRVRIGGDLRDPQRLYTLRERLLELPGYEVDSLVPDGTTEFRFDLARPVEVSP